MISPGSPEADNRVILGPAGVGQTSFAAGSPQAAKFGGVKRKAENRIPLGVLRKRQLDEAGWGLIDRHDRGRFEIHLFSDIPAAGSAIFSATDDFHDISELSSNPAASLIESCGIDLLVDLNGYSATRRLPVIAAHPARLVIAWFNMYATSGMNSYHTMRGQRKFLPKKSRTIARKNRRIPGSYLTFNVHYPVPEVADPPASRGNPVTFGCLASQYKISPAVIRTWCAILKELPEKASRARETAYWVRRETVALSGSSSRITESRLIVLLCTDGWTTTSFCKPTTKSISRWTPFPITEGPLPRRHCGKGFR